MKWLARSLVGLLILLSVIAGFAALYAHAALPQTRGTLALPGLAAEVRIERDAHGIPTIRAANWNDLAYGLGVAHAQDRLWQLETHRRIAAGRLAEAFGPPALDTDRFLRALAVRRAAAAQWAQTPPEARALLLAYARGVNAVIRRQKMLPPEYLLLGLKAEDWDPVDSLAWSIMMAWDLGGNWGTELLRLRLALKTPVERIQQLLPPYPGEAPLATADYAALFRRLGLRTEGATQADASGSVSRLGSKGGFAGLGVLTEGAVEGAGSNNWAVAGVRSAGGAPLLANDPHLKLSAPALWYFARLELPGLKLAGATLPGLPLLVLGQNQQVAWGFTNTAPDVQDLYLERVNPADPGQYQTPQGWDRFETAEEVIHVKGAPDVRLQVRRTRHGPVVSDAGITEDLLGDQPAYVLALRWTALDADAEGVTPALAMNRARSVDAFLQATRGWVAPMQNMAVADVQGHIALVSPGRVPLRRPDNDLKGQVPAPGWDARYDWAGWLPWDQLPRQVDPPAGWLASANQRITPPDYPHYLTSEWAAPWRQRRIEHLLGDRAQHSADSFAAMQADVQSLEAAVWLPWLQRVHSDHPLAAAALRELQGFDGRMDGERAAPLLFWAWSRHFTRRVLADDVGEPLFERSLASRSFRDAMDGVLARNDVSWCDDRRTRAVETCGQQADAAFDDALNELQTRFGADVARWRWDVAHQARSEHRPFSRVAALARWFELRMPVGGDTFTVNVSRVSLRPDARSGEPYLDEHGPSLRAIYDLGDPRQSRFMHSSGQSGLVFSPHYRDFAERWAKVQYLPLWGEGGERGQENDVLLLQPEAVLK